MATLQMIDFTNVGLSVSCRMEKMESVIKGLMGAMPLRIFWLEPPLLHCRSFGHRPTTALQIVTVESGSATATVE